MSELNKLNPLIGSSVNFVRFTGASVDINFLGGENRRGRYADLQIERDFVIHEGDKEYNIQPGVRGTLSPVIDLIGVKIKDIQYYEDETLTIVFDNDYQFTLKAMPKYEAWHITGEGIGTFVASPV